MVRWQYKDSSRRLCTTKSAVADSQQASVQLSNLGPCRLSHLGLGQGQQSADTLIDILGSHNTFDSAELLSLIIASYVLLQWVTNFVLFCEENWVRPDNWGWITKKNKFTRRKIGNERFHTCLSHSIWHVRTSYILNVTCWIIQPCNTSDNTVPGRQLRRGRERGGPSTGRKWLSFRPNSR